MDEEAKKLEKMVESIKKAQTAAIKTKKELEVEKKTVPLEKKE